MNVSFYPVNNNYSFKAKNVSKKETSAPPTQREITDAKIKKSVSECFCVVLGVASLYFFAKIKGKKLFNQNGQNKNLGEKVLHALEPILPSAEHVEKARHSRLI